MDAMLMTIWNLTGAFCCTALLGGLFGTFFGENE